MKLAVFGASGRTGQEVVNLALARGHEVVALVRSPDVMKQCGEKFTVVKMDVMDEHDIVEHLEGCDAVLSCLGCMWSFFCEMTFYTDSGKSIIGAMRRSHVARLVLITAMCTKAEEGNPFLMEFVGRPLQFRRLRDMARLEDYIADNCSDINYTIVRPSLLHSKPIEAQPLLAMADRQFIPEGAMRMSRASLARFMLDALETTKWDRKMVALDMPELDASTPQETQTVTEETPAADENVPHIQN